MGHEGLNIAIIGGIFGPGGHQRLGYPEAPETLLAKGLRHLGMEVSTFCPRDQFDVRSFHVVHAHHLQRATLWLAGQKGVNRLVFTGHDGLLLENKASSLRRACYRLVLPGLDALIASSEREKLLQERLFVGLPTLHGVIPNPIDVSRYSPPRERSTRQTLFNVLYVGQLIALKNVESLIGAIARLPPQYHLSLIYRNPEREASLRDLAYSLGVGDRVTFLGNLSNSAVAEAYRRASCLVLPSRAESYPSVITEALLSGLPVIAANVGGISEQVGEGGIVVTAPDVDPLAEALKYLWANYDTFCDRAVEAGSRLRQTHSVDSVARSHLAFYREALMRSCRSRRNTLVRRISSASLRLSVRFCL